MDDPARWHRLFADLDAQYDAVEAADLELEVRERSRGEAARTALVDRLRGGLDTAVVVDVAGLGPARGSLRAVGSDWLLLDIGCDLLVPLAAVLAVSGLGAWTEVSAEGSVTARLGLRHALRELARHRAPVAVTLVDGRGLHGTLDRVGADFAELAEHPAGEARRSRAVQAVRTVPFGALAALRSS